MIEKINGIYLNRNDKVNIYDVNGMKAMSALHLIENAIKRKYAGIVTVGSRYSPQCNIVSDICEHLNIKSHLFMPNSKNDTNIMKKINGRRNSQIHKVNYGYTSNLIYNAKKFAKENDFYYIDFGMRNAENVDFISHQVEEVPNHIKRIIVPIGSGVNFLGILYGLEKYKRFETKLIGVITGSTESKKYIMRNLPVMTNVDFEIVVYEPNLSPAERYKKVVDFKIGNVILNALYEAKCKEFIKENDLLWIIGK